MPRLNAARLIAVARRTVPWLVGPTVLILRGRSLELANPSACPGLLELLSIAALRSRPDLRIGALVDALQTIVMAAALAAFVELVCRRSRSLAIALGAAAAVGLGRLFPSALAPPWEAAAFGICAAVALLIIPRSRSPQQPLCVSGWRLGAIAIGFAALGVPLWLLAGGLSPRPAAACIVPSLPRVRPAEIAASILSWLGPFAAGLAALGAFVEASRAGWRRSLTVAAAAVAAAALASATTMSLAVAAAPLVVLLWWLAAVGLDELAGATGGAASARLVAAALLVLLPALSTSRRVTEERDDIVRPRGHDRQSLRQMTTVLNLVPQEAAFVEEDATTDVLLRAAVFGGRRRAKPISTVAFDAGSVADALGGHAVFAFPRRQDDLSLRGFVVDARAAARLAADPAGLDGLAQITGRRSCQTAARTWKDFTGASDRIAISADADADRGPVAIYLGGTSAGAPRPDGWSARMLRGFGYFTFDHLTPAGTERLLAEARAIGLPASHPMLAEPFVVRLNLHRTPRAPLALPVALGAPFPVGVVRLEQDAEGGLLTVCDAPTTAVSPLPERN